MASRRNWSASDARSTQAAEIHFIVFYVYGSSDVTSSHDTFSTTATQKGS
jgi:hypothetical protein